MQTWLIYAILSMIFAGVTAILAKFGLQNVGADFGLAVRTSIIFLIVTVMSIASQNYKEYSGLTRVQLLLLLASGVATTLSWIFYYRALKEGPVSYVAAIDKGSIVITIMLSFLLLKEPIDTKMLIGAGFIVAGMVILIWK